MKLTGNENIDKHIKRGLGPMDKVNMDDYWSPHIPFLEYITEVGSEDDIKTMLEDNFGIDNLLEFGDGNDERVHVIHDEWVVDAAIEDFIDLTKKTIKLAIDGHYFP